MKQETIQLIENEARLNETIENLESQISKPLVPADSSSWSSSPKELAYDDSVYEMDDRTEALVSSEIVHTNFQTLKQRLLYTVTL